MQETEIIYEVSAANFLLTLTVGPKLLRTFREKLQYFVLEKYQVQGPMLETASGPTAGDGSARLVSPYVVCGSISAPSGPGGSPETFDGRVRLRSRMAWRIHLICGSPSHVIKK